MRLTSGAKLGSYEIQSPLGAGGIGEVYRARDTRLERLVAVKVLASCLSSDPNLLQRFEREAKAISKLSHPHICTLYDIGHQDGVDYLVMELLEGETLEQRLKKGPLPLELTFRFAVEVADALAQAHRQGIVHRDIKPANIMLTKSGAKLMDFGLAKEAQSQAAAADLETLTAGTKLTSEGTLIGTFQYMAPEQLEGKEADARTDIFALGTVIYEMATGKTAFTGKSRASLIAAILTTEPPPIGQFQPMSPPALDRIVRTCLTKDPEERFQAAHDLKLQLDWISHPAQSEPANAELRRRIWITPLATVAGVLAVLLAVIAWFNLRARTPPPVVRAYLPAPPDTSFNFLGDYGGPPVLSPDGTRVAFCASSNDLPTLWVQSLESGTAKKLEGTDLASHPFWSPDGKLIAFFANGKLKKIPANGGAPTIIADALNPRGGAWGRDNTIVYAPEYRDTLWKVDSAGGLPVRVTTLDPGKHTTHRWPAFLPDGRHFLYYAGNHAGGVPEENGIYFSSLDNGASKLVLASDSAGLYASGYLLFHSQTALMAQKFNPRTGVLSGEALPVVPQVEYDRGTWHTTFTASENGTLLYEPGSESLDIDLAWVDRTGKQVTKVLQRSIYASSYQGLRLSPDGHRLAIALGETHPDIWVVDLSRGTRTRLTFDNSSHLMPSWSADGQRITFVARSGAGSQFTTELHSTLASGGGQDEVLLRPDESGTQLHRPQWSPDGRYLVYEKVSTVGASIWAVPTSGERKPFLVAQPKSPQGRIVSHRLSPDGNWLAYTCTDSGREEVYVTSFPDGSQRWQISQNAGIYPVWRGDSREIYFIGRQNPELLYAAAVRVNGTQFEVESPRPLLSMTNRIAWGELFDASPDGSKFVVPLLPKTATEPMTLVLNWTTELEKK